MLKRKILALIDAKQTEGLAEKTDVFYAVGKLTGEEYEDISSLLADE